MRRSKGESCAPSTSPTRPSPTSMASGSTLSRPPGSPAPRPAWPPPGPRAWLRSLAPHASIPPSPRRRPAAGTESWARGKRGQRHQHARRQQQRLGASEDLPVKFRSQLAVGAGARNDQAAGNRNHERRNHRHQAVADGQDRVGFERLAKVHAMLQNADQESGDDIDAVIRMLATASRCVKREAPSMAP